MAHRTLFSMPVIAAASLAGGGSPPTVYFCPTDNGLRGGGMINDGWDGPGQHATTLYFHVENYSDDFPAADQRAAYIFALATWASYAQIHFAEIAAPNFNREFDFRWATGDHCAVESAECGDPDCPFDGPGNVVAHAGYPPGANSTCISPMPETFAGNVHFDDDDLYEMDNAGDGLSLTFVAAHESGHSLGLTHDSGPGGPHIMRPSVSDTDGMQTPSASDVAHLREGYAAGVGSVTTLEDSGIWVNSAWLGPQTGLAGDPFHTVGAAINGLPPDAPDITIHVLGGLYPESVTISKPCTITAEFSTVYIGQ
ncbi:MAG: matrixin family metalloprotease [Phycisphaeraceae bacterium]|nr:MAG: matrixin family metalloprotease [Phycisphaeraceae bacterium]